MTLNDLMRRNSSIVCVISLNSGLLRRSGWRYTYIFCEWNGDIRRQSLAAMALKCSDFMSLAKIWHY